MHKRNLKTIFKCMSDKKLKRTESIPLGDVPEAELITKRGQSFKMKNPAMNRRGKDK